MSDATVRVSHDRARHSQKHVDWVAVLMPCAFSASLFAFFVLELRGEDNLFNISGFNLHAADIAAMFTGLLFVASGPSLLKSNTFHNLVFAFGMLVAFALFRGILENTFSALFGFRARAVTLGFLFYVAFSSKKLVPMRRLENWLFLFMAMFFVLFCLRLIFGPTVFLQHDTLPYLNIAELEFRPVDTDTVLVMDLAFIYFIGKLIRREDAENRLVYQLAAVIAMVVIIGSRQRTAGLAGLSGLAILFVSDPFLKRYRNVILSLSAVLLVGALIWTTGLQSFLLKMLPIEYQVSFQKTGTLATRVDLWTYALGWRYLHWDIVRQLFGPPAGESLDIIYQGAYWPYSLHSQYVATIMNYGAFGALIWVMLVTTSLFQATTPRRSRLNRAGVPVGTLLGWLVTLLVFGFSYEWRDAAGFFAAMAMAGWSPETRINLTDSFGATRNIRNPSGNEPRDISGIVRNHQS